MRTVMLTGSPHQHGTTAFLADYYIAGAEKAGHQITRFNTSEMDIHPCIGCDTCRMNGGTCAFQDDMAVIHPHLLESDCVVLVTPLYYYGMSVSQKKHRPLLLHQLLVEGGP